MRRRQYDRKKTDKKVFVRILRYESHHELLKRLIAFITQLMRWPQCFWKFLSLTSWTLWTTSHEFQRVLQCTHAYIASFELDYQACCKKDSTPAFCSCEKTWVIHWRKKQYYMHQASVVCDWNVRSRAIEANDIGRMFFTNIIYKWNFEPWEFVRNFHIYWGVLLALGKFHFIQGSSNERPDRRVTSYKTC